MIALPSNIIYNIVVIYFIYAKINK